jgi:hypothetical protein
MVSKSAMFMAIASAFIAGLAGSAAAKPGGEGWQGRATFSITPGTLDFFEHIPCPAAAPVARSGGFLPNGNAKGNGMVLLGNGPRLDTRPVSYHEWSWIIDWTGAGAPAGSQITFDIYCTKGPV